MKLQATLAWRDTDPFVPPHDQEWARWATDVAMPLSNWWNGQVQSQVGQTATPAPKAPARKKAR